ncbi:MAG TPA: glycosyltransferase family 39 protein, partial [Anaerolineae bacterium]
MLILAVFAISTFIQSVGVPIFEGSDEQRHYAYARYLIHNFALPPHYKTNTDIPYVYSVEQEAGQPPLYYLPVALGVHLGRLVSIAFGLLTLWAVSRLARAITPDRPAVGLQAAALVGSVPGFLYVHATITNDVAPILFVTLSLWMVARIVREGPRVRLALAGGVFAALTLLS